MSIIGKNKDTESEVPYELKSIANSELLMIPNYKNTVCYDSDDPILTKKRNLSDEDFQKMIKEEKIDAMNVWLLNNLSVPPQDVRLDSNVNILSFVDLYILELLRSGNSPIVTIEDFLNIKQQEFSTYQFIKESGTIKDLDFAIETLEMVLESNREILMDAHGSQEIRSLEGLHDSEMVLSILKEEALITTIKDMAFFPQAFPNIYKALRDTNCIDNIDKYINSARNILGMKKLASPKSNSKLNELAQSLIKEKAKDTNISKTCKVEILKNVSLIDGQILEREGVKTIEDLAYLHLDDEKFAYISQKIPRLEELSDNALSLFTCIDR